MNNETNKKKRITKFLHDMHRSCTNQIIGGVCGGLAEQTDVPVWIFRATFVTLSLLFGVGIIPYIVLWIFMPLKFKIPICKQEV